MLSNIAMIVMYRLQYKVCLMRIDDYVVIKNMVIIFESSHEPIR